MALIQTKMHLWWTWLEIAVREAAAAQRARRNSVCARSFESPESARLSSEFQCALTGIAATAFAMEALSKELEGAGHKLDESLFMRPKKPTAGFFIGHRLVQAFAFTGSFASSLPARLERLFKLRNDGVHFESEYHAGVHPHPSGTHTAYELTIYTPEKCIESVQLALDVIRECTASAKAGKHHGSAEAAATELPGVLKMLEETIRAEDLNGLL